MIPTLINLLIYLVIVGVILALIWYVADALIPAPLNRIIKVVAVVIAVLILLLVLLQLVGVSGGGMPKLAVATVVTQA